MAAREEVLVFRLKGHDDGASAVPLKAKQANDALVASIKSLREEGGRLSDSSVRFTAQLEREKKLIENTSFSVRQLGDAWKAAERLRARGLAPLRMPLGSGKLSSEIDDFRAAIERANTPIEHNSSLIRRLSQDLKENAGVLNTNVDGFVRFAKSAGLAAVALSAVGGALVARGFNQVTLLQKAELSMAAIISGSADIADVNGRLLEGQEKINAAQEIAKGQIRDLRTYAIETTASFGDMVSVMQAIEKPAIAAHFRIDQIARLVKDIAQTGGALGIPSNMLSQEARALMNGEKGPDNQIANALLGDVTKAEVDRMKKAGEYAEFLTKKMEMFAATGVQAANTLDGAMSNIQDAVDQALGEATKGEADSLAHTLRNLTGEIVSFDEAGNQVFNQDFIAGVRALAGGLGLLAETGVVAVENIPKWKSFFSTLRMGFAGGFAAGQIGRDIKEREEREAREAADREAANREDAIARGRNFLTDRRPGRGLGFRRPNEVGPARVVSPAGWNVDERDREIGEFLRTLDDEVQAIFNAKMQEAQKDGRLTVPEVMAARAASERPVKRFREILGEYTADGKLLIKDLREAKAKMESELQKELSGRVKVQPSDTVDEKAKQRAERLREQLDEYDDFIAKYQRKSLAGDDPFAVKLADIATQRSEAIEKVDDAQMKFKGSGRNWQADIDLINAYFDEAAGDVEESRDQYTAGIRQWLREFEIGAQQGPGADPIARQIEEINRQREAALQEFAKKANAGASMNPIEVMLGFANINQSFDQKVRAFYEQKVAQPIADITRETEQEIADERLRLIEDEVERELTTRLAGIKDWFDEQARAHKDEEEFLKALALEREKREKKAREEAKRERATETVGTREWARALAADVRREMGTIPQSMTRAVVSSRQELTGLFEGVFDSLLDDTFDAGEQIEGLFKGLGKTWARVVSDMVNRSMFGGQSIITQIRAISDNLNQLGRQPGAGKFLDVGLQSAGIGSFVGGMFGGPNNFGAEGGTMGALVGGIIGTYFGATAIGAAIGSAIGTAVGTMIQKGEDSIRVAIKDGVVTVTEKGISYAARQEVETQVKRRVREEMKGWQAVFDALPQELRDQLEAMKIGPMPLDLDGGVEAGDIRDENALGSLGDFLSDKIPKAAFSAYRGSIEAAIKLMGADAIRINQLFEYWGTLQGQELREAVQTFIRTYADQAELEKDFSAPWEAHKTAAAAAASNDPLEQLRKFNADIATAWASMQKLTDVDDIIAAQQRINDMSRQGRQAELAALQQLAAARGSFHDGIAAQREQIQLADMDDQQKLDYFFSQALSLRDQIDSTTDPAEIVRLTQQLQGYISQAMSITGDPDAPGNDDAMKLMRQNLLKILTDVEGVGDQAFNDREKQIQDEAAKAALTLQQAGDKLLLAGDALGGGPTPTLPPNPGGPGGQPGRPGGAGDTPNGGPGTGQGQRPTRDEPTDTPPGGGPDPYAPRPSIGGRAKLTSEDPTARKIEQRRRELADLAAAAGGAGSGSSADAGLDITLQDVLTRTLERRDGQSAGGSDVWLGSTIEDVLTRTLERGVKDGAPVGTTALGGVAPEWFGSTLEDVLTRTIERGTRDGGIPLDAAAADRARYEELQRREHAAAGLDGGFETKVFGGVLERAMTELVAVRRDPRLLETSGARPLDPAAAATAAAADNQHYQELLQVMKAAEARAAAAPAPAAAAPAIDVNALAAALAASVAKALQGLEIPVNVGGQVDASGMLINVREQTVSYIRNNPESIESRTRRYGLND